MSRKNPETSNEAYRSLEVSKITEIYQQILAALAVINEGTFEEIAAHMKVDKARVWKRLSEMERLQLIYRPGRKRLLKSNRNGFTWMLTNSTLPKTDTQLNVYKNGDKSAAGYAADILKASNNTPVVQVDMFAGI